MKLDKNQEGFNLYQSLFHQSHTGIHLSDKNDRIIDANGAFCTMMGYSRDELLNMSVSNLQAPEVRREKGKTILKEQEKFGKESFEAINISRTGRRIPVNIQISPISTPEGKLYFSLVQDITTQKEYEKSLKNSLKEKEVLLKELYHRTKNNMQVVSALLSLQSAHTNNKEAHRVFNNLIDRIRAMSLVHENLYQSKNLSSINFGEYIQNLTDHLLQSFADSADRIQLKLEIEDTSVVLDTAIQCGLILNELIANSFKYAFPGQMKGTITIKLVSTEDDAIRITVNDNGIGMSQEIDANEPDTLGMLLIHTIAEQQLHGEISHRIDKGTEWTLVFDNDMSSPGV